MTLASRTLGGLIVVATMAAPAVAADHVMRVGEVFLANAGGNTASQYVEIEDTTNESFPNAPYAIEVFNANGQSMGSQTLTVPANTRRMLIATTLAQTDLAVTAQATLTLALPADGQLCFKNNLNRIHCLGWGTIVTAVIGQQQTSAGMAPGNGQALQRSANTYCVSTPTPGAVNACPVVDGAPDAGVTPDAASGPDAGTGNPTTPTDDGGCSVGGTASWFGLVLLGLLGLVRRSSRTA